MIKKILEIIFTFLMKFNTFNKIFSIIKNIDKFEVVNVEKNKKIFFLDSNWITRYRLRTFYTKEPETIEWIKNFNNGIFWDIGSNIGLYSLYASILIPNLKVYSFEPSVLNLEMLIKNIYRNNKEDEIIVITNPLAYLNRIDSFNLSTIEKGGANSSFGNKIKNKISFKTNSVNAKRLKEQYYLEEPNYVKIDVDGNEYEILKSILETFSNIQTFLVEVNNNKKEIFKLMENNKYELVFDNENTSNKIWKKLMQHND